MMFRLLVSILLCSISAISHASSSRIYESEVVVVRDSSKNLHPPNTVTVTIPRAVLQSYSIDSIDRLSHFSPGIDILETGLSTQLRIRGVGSENSQGFDQSVGLYSDGVALSRAQLYRMPLFDVEKVSVAKGAQPTRSGKTSIAGAIAIANAKPTNKFSSGFSLESTPAIDGKQASSFISTPINDVWSVRVAAKYKADSGYIDNAYIDDQDVGDKSYGLRLISVHQINPSSKGSFRLEHSRLDVSGKSYEIIKDQGVSHDLGSRYGIDGLIGVPSSHSNTLSYIYSQSNFDHDINRIRSVDGEDSSDNRLNIGSFTIENHLSALTVESTSGYVDFSYAENCDCDFTPSEFVHQSLQESYRQFSQEFKLYGESYEDFSWFGTIYYQSFDQDFEDHLDTSGSNLIIPVVSNYLSVVSGLPEEVAGSYAETLANTGVWREFKQSSEMLSVMGELTYRFTPAFKTSFSLRYLHDYRKSKKRLDIVDLNTFSPMSVSEGAPRLYSSIFGIHTEQTSGHNLEGRRTDSAFDTAVTFSLSASDNIRIYATAKTGSKSGGFDPRSNDTESFEFEGESVSTYEMGIAASILHKSEVDLTLFSSNHRDIQISQFDGLSGFVVGNAKLAEVKGLEISARSEITTSLNIAFAASIFDFEYKDFTNGNCYFGQVPDGDDINGDGQSDLCDYTGEEGRFQPDRSAVIALNHKYVMFSRIALNSGVSVAYNGAHNIHSNNDPSVMQESHSILNAVVEIERGAWSASVMGSNLSNERVVNYAGNAPLSELISGSNTINASISPPRTVSFKVSYKFR